MRLDKKLDKQAKDHQMMKEKKNLDHQFAFNLAIKDYGEDSIIGSTETTLKFLKSLEEMSHLKNFLLDIP